MNQSVDEYVIELQAAETLGVDLLSALVDELKVAPDVWQKLSEEAQGEVIERLRRRVQTLAGRAVQIIAAQGRPTVKATVDSVQFKDGIKAVFTLPASAPSRHELADSTGQTVLVVLADAEPLLGGMDAVRPEPDQPALAIE